MNIYVKGVREDLSFAKENEANIEAGTGNIREVIVRIKKGDRIF